MSILFPLSGMCAGLAVIIGIFELRKKRRNIPTDAEVNRKLDQLNLLHIERNNKRGPHEK